MKESLQAAVKHGAFLKGFCHYIFLSYSKRLTKALLNFQIIMPSSCDSLMEDIEDMVSSSDPTPHERQSARKSIIPRARKKKELMSDEELQADRCFQCLILCYCHGGKKGNCWLKNKKFNHVLKKCISRYFCQRKKCILASC